MQTLIEKYKHTKIFCSDLKEFLLINNLFKLQLHNILNDGWRLEPTPIIIINDIDDYTWCVGKTKINLYEKRCVDCVFCPNYKTEKGKNILRLEKLKRIVNE